MNEHFPVVVFASVMTKDFREVEGALNAYSMRSYESSRLSCLLFFTFLSSVIVRLES